MHLSDVVGGLIRPDAQMHFCLDAGYLEFCGDPRGCEIGALDRHVLSPGWGLADVESRLKMVIEIVDGEVRVGWRPNLNEDGVTRVYTLYGRSDLGTGDWEHPIKPTHKFFKVKDSLPNGAELDISGKSFVPVEP